MVLAALFGTTFFSSTSELGAAKIRGLANRERLYSIQAVAPKHALWSTFFREAHSTVNK